MNRLATIGLATAPATACVPAKFTEPGTFEYSCLNPNDREYA